MSGDSFQPCPAHFSIERCMGAVEQGLADLRSSVADLKGDVKNDIVELKQDFREALKESRKESGVIEILAGGIVKKMIFGGAGVGIVSGLYTALHFIFRHLDW